MAVIPLKDFFSGTDVQKQKKSQDKSIKQDSNESNQIVYVVRRGILILVKGHLLRRSNCIIESYIKNNVTCLHFS